MDILVRIERALAFASSMFLAGAFCLVVLLRYVFDSDLFAYEEWVLLVAFLLYFVGGALASHDDVHIKGDVIAADTGHHPRRHLRGIMTPTESAAIAVLYALPVALWFYRGMDWNGLKQAVIESAATTGSVMVMFFMVMIVSRLLVFEDIPGLAQQLIFSISDNPLVILLTINIVLVLIGMLMDDMSGVLIAAPLLLPIVRDLGVDPVHFAAIIGVNLGMGNITPPTAPLLYLGARIGNTSVNSMLKPTLAMIVFAWIPTLLLTTYIPEVALWLPQLVYGP